MLSAKMYCAMPIAQVPTTVMAQVDSSVGGKTGVNHPLGKNMVGAFYQPTCVLIDTATLQSLPDRELASGISEIVKYGLIRDAPLFEWLEANIERLLARDPQVMSSFIMLQGLWVGFEAMALGCRHNLLDWLEANLARLMMRVPLVMPAA